MIKPSIKTMLSAWRGIGSPNLANSRTRIGGGFMKLLRMGIMVAVLLFAVCAAYATDTGVYAIGITWQNSKGLWFAVGPVQSIGVGCKTEKEAISEAVDRKDMENIKIGDPSNYSSDYKYRIYDLRRKYKSYDLDVHGWAAKRLNLSVPLKR
jgi:hypothetical protein